MNTGSHNAFDSIAKTSKVLIEKISDAIGGTAKPGHIRRIAKADADIIRDVSHSSFIILI